MFVRIIEPYFQNSGKLCISNETVLSPRENIKDESESKAKQQLGSQKAAGKGKLYQWYAGNNQEYAKSLLLSPLLLRVDSLIVNELRAMHIYCHCVYKPLNIYSSMIYLKSVQANRKRKN